jgi:hypothetical protein
MIKFQVVYDNPDGMTVTKDLWFHMSMRQLTQMEVEASQNSGTGLHDKLTQLVKAGSHAEMLTLFEDIIGRAYGEREDNNPDSFLKSEMITERFMSSMAYDALFTKLVTNPAEMLRFINGLIPKELLAAVEAQGGAEAVIANAGKGGNVDLSLPAEDTGPKLLTDEELTAATGLSYPKDGKDNVVPWAYREPTDAEVRRMSHLQLLDITQRKGKGWEPKS